LVFFLAMRPRIYYSYSTTPKRGIRFGREELRDIGLAVGALTLAFTIMWLSPIGGTSGFSVFAVVIILLISLVAVLTGFLMHELAHKIVAVRYGLWSEFKANRTGLIFSIVTAFFGIVLAAPGAVMIAGPVSLKQSGKISAAGPLTNLGFGAGFLGILLLLLNFNAVSNEILRLLMYEVISVNLILGTFNMIPFPPLDGSKIWWWNKPLWIGMIAVFATLLGYFFFILF